MELLSELPSFVKYVITGLSSFLAILGLFVDKGSHHFKYIAPLFITLVIALGVFQAADSVNSDKDSELAKNQRENILKLADTTATATLKTSSYLTDELLSQPLILKDFGLTKARAGKPLDQLSTADLVKGEILEANKYRIELISEKPPSQRLDTTLWYYNKEIDSPELGAALNEMGFTVKNMVAKRNQANDPTNAVWYGPNVELNDYKAVIVSLIRAGIDIRRTGPSCKNLAAKQQVIEIGASDLASGLIDGITKPTKSIKKIRAAKSFEDIADFSCKT